MSFVGGIIVGLLGGFIIMAIYGYFMTKKQTKKVKDMLSGSFDVANQSINKIDDNFQKKNTEDNIQKNGDELNDQN